MIPVLNDQTPASPMTLSFLQELKKQGFKGEIATDQASRLIAATDNSIYQVLPAAVVFPAEKTDLLTITKLLAEPQFAEVTISPRGGGTGTNGQSLTSGIMIDVSRHMNRILEVNFAEGWVRVEPGVVLDQLNKEIKSQGFFFAPDLSPSNRATLGGMASTDACGKGSRVYGKTSDHILDMELAVLGGHSLQTSPLDAEQLDAAKARQDRIGEIHRVVDQIAQDHQKTIEETFPKLTRFLTGYNLAKIYDGEDKFNLNYLLSGSEGTLAFLSELKLRLTPIPACRQLVLVKYLDFDDGLKAAGELLSFDPAAIETIDGTIVGLARKDILWSKISSYFQGAQDHQVSCVNLLEFFGDYPEEVSSRVKKLLDAVEASQGQPGKPVGCVVAVKAEDIQALWSLRKKGVGLLGNRPGQRRPIPFVEDTVVPPEHLADYIREFRELLDSHGLEYGMFGHVDVGCLHVRPALNLREVKDEQLVRKISDEVMALVKKYGGVIWGEHGKGLRSEYMPEFFGPLYDQLQEIKGVFDPCNQINPGKLATPKGSCSHITKLDEAPLRGHYDKQISEPLRDTYAVSVNCNGNGACYNFDPDDVMCPSYKVTRDRRHSPKGRAGLIREWLRQLSNQGYDANRFLPYTGRKASGADGADFSSEVYEAMSGCLSCKACSTQCPIKVDIPDLKARFLNHYHSRYQRPLKDLLISKTEALHIRLSKLPLLYNLPLKLPFFGALSKQVLGMVDAPSLSSPTLKQICSRSALGEDLSQLDSLNQSERERSVLLVQDAVTSLYDAQVVADFLELCKKLGIRAFVLPLFENGKAKHVKGFLPEFVETARSANKLLQRYEKTGVPMVGVDPALTLTYREEYDRFLAKERGAYKVDLIQEWLLKKLDSLDLSGLNTSRKDLKATKVAFLGHCGEKTSYPETHAAWKKIFAGFGLDLKMVPVGCCGMAGSFGHEVDHLQESKVAFQLSWGPQMEKLTKEGYTFLATGYSCRSQVKRLKGTRLKHPLQFLLQLL